MEIKWNNVIAFGMALAALAIVMTHGQEMAAFLHAMKDVGPGHTPEEQVVGLIACGLIFVFVVALVRILTNDRGGDRK